jgi:hypothetical protein
MESFLAHHQSAVKGSLSGFDRIRFRGTLRWIANVSGLGAFLSTTNVLLKNFASYATNLTDRIKESTEKIATQSGRPLRYLSSSTTRKEDVAREIAQQDQISAGLVCVLTAVEPCRTFTVGPNRQAQRHEGNRDIEQHDRQDQGRHLPPSGFRFAIGQSHVPVADGKGSPGYMIAES